MYAIYYNPFSFVIYMDLKSFRIFSKERYDIYLIKYILVYKPIANWNFWTHYHLLNKTHNNGIHVHVHVHVLIKQSNIRFDLIYKFSENDIVFDSPIPTGNVTVWAIWPRLACVTALRKAPPHLSFSSPPKDLSRTPGNRTFLQSFNEIYIYFTKF